jgi:iron(III) transport system ATP-binding protein
MSLNDQLLDDGRHWLPPEQRNIGMIFQDYALFPHLTVAQNIAFGLRGLSCGAQRTKVEEMLALVHLTGYGERYPHQLSGGQQQRVAIARSLAYQPDLLLLDEPFSNIDTQVRHDLIREIRRIFKAQGVTAIFVTHSREEAFAFADKMAVMNHGVIEQFGSASELYYQPSSKFVADFLGGGSYLPATCLGNGRFKTVLGEVEASSPATLAVGQACHLLLRPQQLILHADASSEVAIREQQFMGDHCRYIVELAGKKLIAVSAQPLSVGERVSVSVDQQGIVAFSD